MENRRNQTVKEMLEFGKFMFYVPPDDYITEMSAILQIAVNKIENAKDQSGKCCTTLYLNTLSEQIKYVSAVASVFLKSVRRSLLCSQKLNVIAAFQECWEELMQITEKQVITLGWTVSGLLDQMLEKLKLLNLQLFVLDIDRKDKDIVKLQLVTVKFMLLELSRVDFDAQLYYTYFEHTNNKKDDPYNLSVLYTHRKVVLEPILDAPYCQNCGESDFQPKTCTACKLVNYCSVSCQKKDWKIHKKDCRKNRKESQATASPKISCCVEYNCMSSAMPIDPMNKNQVRCSFSKCHVSESKDRPLKKCSKCKMVSYCSSSCQEKDWKNHMIDCRSMPSEERRVESCDERAKIISKDDPEVKTTTNEKNSDDIEDIDPREFSYIELKEKQIGKKCWRCSKRKSAELRLIKCPKCRLARYCSDMCLNEDRDGHKRDCRLAWLRHMSEVE